MQNLLYYRTKDKYSYNCIPKSLLYKLWMVGLCLSVIWSYHTTHGQDTMSIQHSGYHHHKLSQSPHNHHNLHCTKHCTSMIAKLEQRVHHRIRDVEHRAEQRNQAQLRANNKTAAIEHTEKLMHHVLEELQVGTGLVITGRNYPSGPKGLKSLLVH